MGDCQQSCCPAPCTSTFPVPSFNPCPPCEGPPCDLQQPCCCDASACYQQPPRQSSYKPLFTYNRPTCPMETSTVMQRSYVPIDPSTAQQSRMAPIIIPSTLRTFQGPMESKTIQKLSYLGHCGVQRTPPINPTPTRLNFVGPMYAMTTQKHDFVPKPMCRTQIIKPRESVQRSCMPLERCTVNKLSFIPVDVMKNPPPCPIRPGDNIRRPDAPSESCTIQKLSYLPVCLPPKEELPWAKEIRVMPAPCVPMCTTYKLSYLPNCNNPRTQPIAPTSCKLLGNGPHSSGTIYKLSYVRNEGIRPAAILPRNSIHGPTAPIEKCTTYKMSYIPNCNNPRTAPVKPPDNYRKVLTPMYQMTTQKHDFVPKPICRRGLILPPTSLLRSNAQMEKCTVNKLSYLPVDVCQYRPPAAIIPNNEGIKRADGPMSNCTTYKLSYIPQFPAPKETLPWAAKRSYSRPTAPMATCTIQKLSYPAPGNYMSKGCCSCKNNQSNGFPKAGICN